MISPDSRFATPNLKPARRKVKHQIRRNGTTRDHKFRLRQWREAIQSTGVAPPLPPLGRRAMMGRPLYLGWGQPDSRGSRAIR
jgi:hypothetical protein